MITEAQQILIGKMMPVLNERERRFFLGAISDMIGFGGMRELSRLTGVTVNTIRNGRDEMRNLQLNPKGRGELVKSSTARVPGGGRKPIEEKNPQIWQQLYELMDGNNVKFPDEPLCWSTKGLRVLSSELENLGITMSHATMGKLLEQMGFTLMTPHQRFRPDEYGEGRDGRFRMISESAKRFLRENQPVVSLFLDTEVSRSINSLEQGLERTRGAQTNETAAGDEEFNLLMDLFQNWWLREGKNLFPDASEMMIGISGFRQENPVHSKWLPSFQAFADQNGVKLYIFQFPPGSYRWNQIRCQRTTSSGEETEDQMWRTVRATLQVVGAPVQRPAGETGERRESRYEAMVRMMTEEDQSESSEMNRAIRARILEKQKEARERAEAEAKIERWDFVITPKNT